ncbi:MAG: SEC59/DGK1/VTE5 family protein [Aphanocapsa sp. GSE-SYN-MK-11-07L]|jgi:phytol kinase|nr:SEC59/DGK1/VTE5 family protein [Aphanocapsa sp. GSE-SYN-MK-11-07L]
MVAIWLGIVVLAAELVNRYTKLGVEISRKIVHIGTGQVILLAWWFGIPAWIGVAASAFFCVLTLISYRYPILPSVSGVGRKSWGTFFYALSIGTLIACFWTQNLPEYAAIGVLIMTWGDGLAALVGQKFGCHTYTIWSIAKSWEGSIAMAIASALVTSSILFYVQGNLWQTWVIAIVVALVATGLEAFSKFGIDNLTVPLASAFLCFGLERLWR